MMILPVLADVPFIMKIVSVLFVLVAIALIFIVLIQKGKGGGLSAALGGAGTSSVFGSKTGDFLTWSTITLAGVFLLLAVVMAKFFKPATPSLLTTPERQTAPLQQAPAQAPKAPASAPTAPAAPSAPTAPATK